MKNLFLIRHAKSSWKNLSLKDFDRPLNKRGKQNLKLMSELFSKRFSKPDLIISSPAERAKATAKGFIEKLDYKIQDIQFLNELYLADAEDISKILSTQKENYNSIVLFGHNPGLTDFVNFYSNSYIENIPTCGIVNLRMEDSWQNIKHHSFSIADFLYPKMFENI